MFLDGVLPFFLFDCGVLILECGVLHAKDPLDDSDPVGDVKLESFDLLEAGVLRASCVSFSSSFRR